MVNDREPQSTSADIDLSKYAREGSFHCESPYSTPNGPGQCRNCPECRKRHKKHWIGRMAAEMAYATTSRFVTLTYDDEPATNQATSMTNCQTGLELPRSHMKQYFRQRRKKYDLKHFTVGEYGGQTGRPHWHSMQFYYGESPTDVLNFSTHNYGWTRGNSQYELPRSKHAAAAYVYDYLDKGGKMLRPSPGLGLEYLRRFARLMAEHNHLFGGEYGLTYYIPGNRHPKTGKLWRYHIPSGHHYAPLLVGEYLDAYEQKWDHEPNYRQFERINYDV